MKFVKALFMTLFVLGLMGMALVGIMFALLFG